MTLQICVSERAARDADTIFDWLTVRSADGAFHWYEAYLVTLRTLLTNAQGCPLAPEADKLGIDLRQVLFHTRKGRTYRSLFVIRDDVIHVVSVRGPGQDFVTDDDVELPT